MDNTKRELKNRISISLFFNSKLALIILILSALLIVEVNKDMNYPWSLVSVHSWYFHMVSWYSKICIQCVSHQSKLGAVLFEFLAQKKRFFLNFTYLTLLNFCSKTLPLIFSVVFIKNVQWNYYKISLYFCFITSTAHFNAKR